MTVTESNHRHTSSISPNFFSHSPRYHVRPIISKNGDHQIGATAAVSAFMPVQAGQNLHECNSCLAGDETGVLQITPPRTGMFLS